MGYHSLLRSPKKEEQQVPDTIETEFVDMKDAYGEEAMNIMDELGGIWGLSENEEKIAKDSTKQQLPQLSWDFMDWDQGFIHPSAQKQEEEEEEEEERSEEQIDEFTRKFFPEEVIKKEKLGFWDEDESTKVTTLNLNLNYQEVLDAWSDRGPLWADEYSLSMASNGYYMGEVPVMEEERARREASVLRYKEKRQTRLFSKKIRYQVRKLNADKRPRLKGRFVKRVS
ncbi:zinc finger protein CONSTANS-LIKE 16-like [Mangifera indica]|uniref:zinc finger protein CONSTANS-LIKE 16-like n=1 Tax=Mangifera indica TaxID=29780 RepID=UPI001CFA6AE5|nr:zinc finger protein CONSTANS-LIKE 16-like [Mangifera indica]WED40966.1 CONSTANS-like 6 [Mangifera indica]